MFEKGKERLETNPTNWIELAKKYKLEDLVTAFEKELRERGFPIRQGELLPEMKKVLRR